MNFGQNISIPSINYQQNLPEIIMTELNAFLKHHPTLLFAEDMQTLCEPLFKLGIDYFSHVKLDKHHNMTANASNPEYFRFYFEQGFHQADLHIAPFELSQRYVLWKHVIREGKAEELYQNGIPFGLFHIFTIIEHKNAEKNFYHFAAQSQKEFINEFYFGHLDLLEQFIIYYNHSLQHNHHLNQAYSMPYAIQNTLGKHHIPTYSTHNLSMENIQEYLTQIRIPSGKGMPELSRRELQCALFLIEGKTSMEIAQLLHLSPRTVEVYFNRLKERFGSKNKIQLTRHLIEAGLLNMS